MVVDLSGPVRWVTPETEDCSPQRPVFCPRRLRVDYTGADHRNGFPVSPRTLMAGAPLIGLAVACGDPDPGSAAAGPDGVASEEDRPTTYTYEPDDGGGAAFDAAVLEEALDDLFTRLPFVTAEPMLEGYASVMDRASSGCPTWSEVDGNVFWYGYCTSEDGSYWDGYSFFNVYSAFDLFGDGSAWDAEVLSGAATVRSGAEVFHVGGSLAQGQGVGPDGSDRWVTQTLGSFALGGEAAADTWVEQGVVPSVLLYAIRYNGVDGGPEGQLFYANGSVRGVSDAVSAFHLGGLQAGPTALGFGCALEPFGTLEIRDHSGTWYTLDFDYTDEGVYEGTCDGCGAAYVGAEYQGEVCTDTSVLWSWEGAPW